MRVSSIIAMFTALTCTLSGNAHGYLISEEEVSLGAGKTRCFGPKHQWGEILDYDRTFEIENTNSCLLWDCHDTLKVSSNYKLVGAKQDSEHLWKAFDIKKGEKMTLLEGKYGMRMTGDKKEQFFRVSMGTRYHAKYPCIKCQNSAMVCKFKLTVEYEGPATKQPTRRPTGRPSRRPTSFPTARPTSPTPLTRFPTAKPTVRLTDIPTMSPTTLQTTSPTSQSSQTTPALLFVVVFSLLVFA